MVWKSPLRHYNRGNESEASSSPSQPFSTSPAEIQVREIASRIGLREDSEILATVCHKMRKEYVVEEWQLPVLDSRQWERLNAPIGLAVAVRHISTHQLGGQRLQLPFSERSHDNPQIFVAKGEGQRSLDMEEENKSTIFPLSHHKHEDTARTSSVSREKPSKEKLEDKTEILSKSIFNDEFIGSSTDLRASETKSSSTFEDSTVTTNEEIQDKTIETEKQARTNEKEQSNERNNTHLAPVGIEKNKELLSEVCAEWLEVDKVATEEGEKKSFEDDKYYVETETSISETKKNGGDCLSEENGGLETTIDPVSNAMDTAIALIESVNRKLVENNAATIKTEVEPADILESEKKEKIQLGITVEGQIEGEASEVEIRPIENTEADNSTKQLENSEEKELQLQKTPDGHIRDSASTSIQIEELLETYDGTTKREDPPETSSSDSESESNTNIFSGIENSVSFSEDEEDSKPNDKDTSKLGCLLDQLESMEDSAISSRDDTETNLLLLPEYGADDITVAVSNVSPECKKAASERNKQIRKYRYEYDRESEISSLEIDTTALQDILVKLPDDDHRAILSQLMIMTNARDKDSRTNLAFQVQDSLVALVEKNEIDVETTKAVQLIFQLSRLKKTYRLVFGKSLFKAMSKLYKRTEKTSKKKSPKKKLGKSSSHDRKKHAQDEQELKRTGTAKRKGTPGDGVCLPI